MGEDMEVTVTVTVAQPLVSGMMRSLCLEEGILLKATKGEGVGTKVEYAPYVYQAETSRLEKVPDEQALTRTALYRLLRQYGFTPMNEG